MPTQYVLDNVTRNEDQDWSNDNGQFHVYTLKAQGLEQLVRVNRKPESPVLQAGQEVWLETQGTNRDGTLKGRVQKPPQSNQSNGQQSFQPTNDPTRKSIEAQVAVKAAVEYARGHQSSLPSADVVAEVAKTFFKAMQEMQA